MERIKFQLKDQWGNKVWEPVRAWNPVGVDALHSLAGRKTYEDRHLTMLEKLGIQVEKVVIVNGKELSLADNE
jgi:hypothetical protein